MTEPPTKYQKAKPRAKTKPARRITLSHAERAKYEAAANGPTDRDQKYRIHVPVDRPKV